MRSDYVAEMSHTPLTPNVNAIMLEAWLFYD